MTRTYLEEHKKKNAKTMAKMINTQNPTISIISFVDFGAGGGAGGGAPPMLAVPPVTVPKGAVDGEMDGDVEVCFFLERR